MSQPADQEYRYDRLTWREVHHAAEDEVMIVVPFGATEDHGHHLPLDVDRQIVEAICDRTVRDREDTLLFPTVNHGYLPHHMDYPGGITIAWKTFVDYAIDICVSLAHHGFEKLLLVNAHGSNDHLLDLVARQIVIQYPGVHCASLSWWQIDEVRQEARDVRDGGPQGSAHAGEMETSIYMHLFPERVPEDARVRDVGYPDSKHFYPFDLAGERPDGASTPVKMMEWWSTLSSTGTLGDATVVSPEKGERFLAAAVTGLHSVLDEFVDLPHRPVEDHHSRPVADREYDPFRPR